MLIGEVSRRSGVSARMLRHYDALGLVRPSGRTAGGYRQYADADIRRIFHVEALRSLGLSLSDVQRALDDPSFSPSALVGDLIEQATRRIAQEEELLSRLRSVQSTTGDDWGEVLHIVMLLRALGSGEPEMRQRAALNTAGTTPPAHVLADAVLTETEPNAAGAMRWALARAGDDGLGVLAQGLQSSRPEVRRRAVEAIGDLPGDAVTAVLLGLLVDDDDVVRSRAALAVASRARQEAIPTLIDMVVEGIKDVEAAEALAHLAPTAEVAAGVTATLRQRAGGAHPTVRRRVVQALAELPGVDTHQALAEFAQDTDPGVSRTAEALLQRHP